MSYNYTKITRQDLALSVAKVRVYYESLSYTLITESEAISGTSLLGTFGKILFE